MSDEYIEKEDAIQSIIAHDLVGGNARGWAEYLLEYTSTADVAPVRHGRWMPLTDCSNEGIYCSACYKKVYRAEYSNTMKMHSAYCPNCGAKMDEGGSNGTDD